MNNEDNGFKVSLSKKAQSVFRVGVDGRGNWVALNQDGRCGGLFIGRHEAIRFALSQNGNQKNQIVLVETPLDLDLAVGEGRASYSTAAASDRKSSANQPER
ncbi:MAG TPA: hypothetical protein VEX16_03130 [Methyloceanibacter sp.]|nr:hypothetical protein [Methyloceanibacter sp.]